MIAMSNLVSNLRFGDTVIFFPSYGNLARDGRTWKVHISGVVIEPDKVGVYKRMLLTLLRRVLKASPEEFEGKICQQRIRAFAAATARGKRIAVRLGDRVYALKKKSKNNGHFRGTLRIQPRDFDELVEEGVISDGQIRFDVVMPHADERQFGGRAHLLSDTGTSVISDIDDTIKMTGVTSRKSLLRNTFLRKFKSIDGMSDVYNVWKGQGVEFHYVSSSPWQLYDPIAALLQSDGFPDGTMNLRIFRLRDHMLRRVLLVRRRGKASVVKKLVATFPQRKFVLVGDSGERDANLYGAVTRKFPERVAKVLIRNLPDNPMSEKRCQKAFKKIDADKWGVFEEPDEIIDFFDE